MTLTKTHDIKTTGSSLMGYVKSDYTTLVTIFGEPTVKIGGDKTTVEWHLEFEDDALGTIMATIYDWKTDTTPLSTYNWHIGGFSPSAVYAVEDYMGLFETNHD